MFRSQTSRTTAPFLLAAALLGFAALATGCGGDGGDDNPMDNGNGTGSPPPTELVHEWTFQSAQVNGSPASLAVVLDWVPNATAAKIDIQANGAYVYQEVNSSGGQLYFETGFVIVEGDQIEVNALQDSDGPLTDSLTFAWTLNGGLLRLEMTDGATTTVLVLTM